LYKGIVRSALRYQLYMNFILRNLLKR